MMKKKVLTIIAVIVISTIFLCGCEEEDTIIDDKPKAVYVADDGSANFTEIQDAIDYAPNGSTIYVRNGIYYETLIIDKSINLQGESKNNTIIQYKNVVGSTGLTSVITINSDNCIINNFKIVSEYNILDDDMWGINIKSSNNEISNNIIMYANRGIYIDGDSINNYISGNSISQAIKAITSASSENTITNNVISYTEKGVFLDRQTKKNTVTYNILSNSEEGIVLENSDENNISNNDISSCEIYGIYISGSYNNIISYNIISNNEYGIRLLGSKSKNNKLFKNLITNNTKGLLCCCSSNENIIYLNNFKQNSEYSANATDEVVNQWDNGIIGNYWDDYIDKYPDAIQKMGIWDTPYDIPLLENKDRFPLVNPVDI